MNKCWISFYLGMCLVFSFLTVQSQPVTQFTFTSIKNIVAAPVPVNPYRLTAITDFSLTRNKDRTILARYNYTLSNRMFIYDVTTGATAREEIWKSFAISPEFSIKKINGNP